MTEKSRKGGKACVWGTKPLWSKFYIHTWLSTSQHANNILLASLCFNISICKIKKMIIFWIPLGMKQKKVKVFGISPGTQSVIVLMTNKDVHPFSLEMLTSEFAGRKYRVSKDVFSFARRPHHQGQAVPPTDMRKKVYTWSWVSTSLCASWVGHLHWRIYLTDGKQLKNSSWLSAQGELQTLETLPCLGNSVMGCTQLPMLLGIATYVVERVYCNNVRNKKKLLYFILFCLMQKLAK